jgi:hypothetical protein
MTNFLIALVGIVVIALIFALPACQYKLDNDDITNWASTNKTKLVSTDIRVFNTGPYIVVKGYQIYRVETTNNVYWFRYGIFGREIYQEKNGDYKKIE